MSCESCGLRATEGIALGIAFFSLLLGTLFYRELRLRRREDALSEPRT